MHNMMVLEFHSGEAARNFIEDIDRNEELKPKVNFMLSVGQRLALRKLNRAEHRPNETPLNVSAFYIVLFAGAFTLALSAVLSNWRPQLLEFTSVAVGILLATLSGAVAALGLPTTPESVNRLKRIRVDCDDSISKPLTDLAKKY